MGVGVVSAREDQRITFGSQFPPSAMWVLGPKSR